VGNKDVLKRWLRSGASSLLVLGLLTGCTGTEPEPTFTPTLPDSTPSPDDDPEPDADVDPVDELEPPEIPELSDDPVEAAEQVVDYFIAAYNYGYKASDPEPLLAISHSECGTCNLHAERMADQRETGEYVEGGELHIRNSEIYLLETDETLVDVDLDQDGWISYDRDGTEIETVKAKLVFLDFVLYQNKNEWKIRAVGDGSHRAS